MAAAPKVRLQSTSGFSLRHGVKCLVYAGAGAGKTRLIASAPRPVIFSAESGLLSLREYNLPYMPIASLNDLIEAYNWATQSREANQFDTLALDSVSEIAEVVLSNEKSKTRDGRKAYGDAQDEMIKIFRSFRDIVGKHVYFSAKQEFTTDGNTGGKFYQPMFPGNKLAQAAPYFFDEVFQLVPYKDPGTGNRQWWLRTAPDLQNVAKDRSGTLAEWENADPATGGGLTYIFNKMLQG